MFHLLFQPFHHPMFRERDYPPFFRRIASAILYIISWVDRRVANILVISASGRARPYCLAALCIFCSILVDVICVIYECVSVRGRTRHYFVFIRIASVILFCDAIVFREIVPSQLVTGFGLTRSSSALS